MEMDMFTYKWHDEIGGEHGAMFAKGWQRLNYCHAATYHHGYVTPMIDHDTHKTINHEWDWYYLVSYATPIAKVVKHTDYGKAFTTFTVVFDSNTFDISCTTIRQLNRFLRDIGCNVTHKSLYDAIDKGDKTIVYHSLTQKVCAIDNVHVIDFEIENALPDFISW